MKNKMSGLTLRILAMLGFLLLFNYSLSVMADDWSLKDNNNVTYTLSGLHGKWVLVNFWAPWCASCAQEMPDLEDIQGHYKNLQVIGVAVMYKSKKEVSDMVRVHQLTYPIVLGDEDIASNFGEIEGLPTSYLYSPSGKLVHRFQGAIPLDKIKAALVYK